MKSAHEWALSHLMHVDITFLTACFFQIDVVAFDKTGTLTEDGLDLYTIVPVKHDLASSLNSTQKFMCPIEPDRVALELDLSSPITQCMVVCHTLTTIDGKLTGDPLDMKMFEATRWRMMEPTVSACGVCLARGGLLKLCFASH